MPSSSTSSKAASFAACLFPCCFPRKPSSSSRSTGEGDGPNEQTPLLRDNGSSTTPAADSTNAAPRRRTLAGAAPTLGSKKIGSLQSAEKTEKEISPFGPPPSARVDDRVKLNRIVNTLQGTFLPVGPAHSHRHLLSATSPHIAPHAPLSASTSVSGARNNHASSAPSSRSNSFDQLTWTQIVQQKRPSVVVEAGSEDGEEEEEVEDEQGQGQGQGQGQDKGEVKRVSKRPYVQIRSIRLTKNAELPGAQRLANAAAGTGPGAGGAGGLPRNGLPSGSAPMARQASTSTGGSSNSASDSVVLGLAGKDDRRSSKLVQLWGKEEDEDAEGEEEGGEGKMTLDQHGDTGKRKLSIDTTNTTNKNDDNHQKTSQKSSNTAAPSAPSTSASDTNNSTPTGGPSPALTPTRTPLTLNMSSTTAPHSSPATAAAVTPTPGGAGPISPSGSAVALQSLSMTAAAVPPPSAPSLTLDGQSTDAQKSLRKSSSSAAASGRRQSSTASLSAPAPLSPAGGRNRKASVAAADPASPTKEKAATVSPEPQENDWQARLEERLRAVTLEQGPLMESWEEADMSNASASVATPPFTGVVAAGGDAPLAVTGKGNTLEDI